MFDLPAYIPVGRIVDSPVALLNVVYGAVIAVMFTVSAVGYFVRRWTR